MNEVNKEDVKQFIRDMKSVCYWSNKIMDINLRLEDIANQLEGVSSPAIKDVIYENAGNPKKNNKVELIMKEDDLIKERNKFVNKINEVANVFDLIEEDENLKVKQRMIELYLCRSKLDDLIIKFPMHKATFYRTINKSIINAMLRLSNNKKER